MLLTSGQFRKLECDVFIFGNIGAADIPAAGASAANVSANDEIFHEIFQEQKRLQKKF